MVCANYYDLETFELQAGARSSRRLTMAHHTYTPRHQSIYVLYIETELYLKASLGPDACLISLDLIGRLCHIWEASRVAERSRSKRVSVPDRGAGGIYDQPAGSIRT